MSKNTKLIGSNIGSDLKSSPVAMLVNGKWQIYTLDTYGNFQKSNCYSASNSKIGSQHPFYTKSGETLTIKNSSGTSTDNVTCTNDDNNHGILNSPGGGICDPNELMDKNTYTINNNLICSSNNQSESKWYCLSDEKMCKLSTSNLSDTSYGTRLGCATACVPSTKNAIHQNNDVLVFPYPNSDNIDSIKKANFFYNTYLISTSDNIPIPFALSFPDLLPFNNNDAYFAECKNRNILAPADPPGKIVNNCAPGNPMLMDYYNVYNEYKSSNSLQTGFLFPEPKHSALSIGHTLSKIGNSLNNTYFCPLYYGNIILGYKLYTIINRNAHRIYYYFNPGGHSSHIDCDDKMDVLLTAYHYSSSKTNIQFNPANSVLPSKVWDIFAFTEVYNEPGIVELGIMWKLIGAGNPEEFKNALITPHNDPDNPDSKIYYPIYKRTSSSVQSTPVARLLYASNAGCGTFLPVGGLPTCDAGENKYYGTLIDELTVYSFNSWGSDGGKTRITHFVPSSTTNSPAIGCRSIVKYEPY